MLCLLDVCQFIDAMFKWHAALALLSSMCFCTALPVLNIPREATLESAKPPFPIVNVIADQPFPSSARDAQLRRVRNAQQSLLEQASNAQKRFEILAGFVLEDPNRQLETLRQTSAHVSSFTQGTISKH